jgi:hypothetical protein
MFSGLRSAAGSVSEKISVDLYPGQADPETTERIGRALARRDSAPHAGTLRHEEFTGKDK